MIKYFQLIFVLTIFAACSHEKSQKHKQQTTVDLDTSIAQPTIYAKINGIQGRFVVDTGAGTSVISERFYNEHLNNNAEKIIEAPMNSQPSKSILADYELDNFKIKETQTLISKSPIFNEWKFDGIIGFDIIKKFDLAIDNKLKKITIGKIKEPSNAIKIDIIEINNAPLVFIHLANEKHLFILDTGSDLSTLNNTLMKIIFKENPKEDYKKHEAIGNFCNIDSCQNNIPLSYITTKTQINSLELNNTTYLLKDNNLLGMDILKNFNIYLKAGEESLYLQKID